MGSSKSKSPVRDGGKSLFCSLVALRCAVREPAGQGDNLFCAFSARLRRLCSLSLAHCGEDGKTGKDAPPAPLWLVSCEAVIGMT
jgi:hypothetical protein